MSKNIDEMCLTFGEYRGISPADLSIINPHYIVWMYDNVKPIPCSLELMLACQEEVGRFDEQLEVALANADDQSLVNIFKWESEVYPKICAEVRRLGQIARESGLPRVCNLGEEYQTLSGEFLNVYLQAWMQGYDGRDPNRQLEEFIKVENHLATLPTTPYYGDRD